jgi:hypothetical protein
MEIQRRIKEIGRLRSSFLERFGRNQRRAFQVSPSSGERKGVHCFRTWEEVKQWDLKRHQTD